MTKSPETTAVYAVIYKNLRSCIFGGELRPGDLLPSENQLCSEYGTSRETVRKGLKKLEQEGLIFARPKVGYFVSTPNQSDLTLSFADSAQGCTTQYSDIHGILPDKHLQNVLKVKPNQKIIELSQITRNAAGKPVAYTIKYVPYERAYPSVEREMHYAVLPDITLEKVASFEYYTDIEVSAAGATERVADALGCDVGEPLLLIEQTFICQDGRRIGYSVQFRRSQFGKLRGTSGHQI